MSALPLPVPPKRSSTASAKPQRITPEYFFDKLLAARLKTVGISEELRKRLVFRLFGDKGGQWTVDLSRKRVHRGATSDPDLYIEMDRTDFSDMLVDELDSEEAIMAGRVRMRGDYRLLHAMSALLLVQSGATKAKPSNTASRRGENECRDLTGYAVAKGR